MGRINAGQLTQRITLITPGAPVSDGRGWVDGPETRTQVWARVRPIRGAEALRLGQTINTELYEITIRHRANTGPKERVEWEGKTLNLQALVPDEYGEYQLLTCINGGQ